MPPITVTENPNAFLFGRAARRNSHSLTGTEPSYHCRKTKKAFDQSRRTQITQLTNQDSRKADRFQREKKHVKQGSCSIGSVPDWSSASHDNRPFVQSAAKGLFFLTNCRTRTSLP